MPTVENKSMIVTLTQKQSYIQVATKAPAPALTFMSNTSD